MHKLPPWSNYLAFLMVAFNSRFFELSCDEFGTLLSSVGKGVLRQEKGCSVAGTLGSENVP